MKRFFLLLAVILAVAVFSPHVVGACDPTSDNTPC
jgi:predicted cobalt transporter CbtA